MSTLDMKNHSRHGAIYQWFTQGSWSILYNSLIVILVVYRMYMPTDRFLEHVLDEHNERRRRRREGEEFVARDMVDLLLQLADDPNLEVPIKRDGGKAFTLAFQMEQDLIVAATNTSAVTLGWATRNSSRSRRSSPRPPRSWIASSAGTAWSRRGTSRASPTSRPS